MTREKNFKKLVRKTAAQTSRSYVATRAALRTEFVRSANENRALGGESGTDTTAPTIVPTNPGDEHIALFQRGGVLHIKEGFPREIALDIQAALWTDVEARLAVSRDDPTSWNTGTQDWGPKRAVESVEAIRARHLSRLDKVFDRILGAETWSHPRAWGSGTMATAPHSPDAAWTLTDREWHWDGAPVRGCWYFILFTDIHPRSGATLVVEGTGPLLRSWIDLLPEGDDRTRLAHRFLASSPYLRTLTGTDRVDRDPEDLLGTHVEENGHSLRVVELAGNAGDVFIMDSNSLHARPSRTGRTPRFQARQFLHWGTPPRSWRGPSAIRREQRRTGTSPATSDGDPASPSATS